MLLSEIEFGAFLAYSPNGTDDLALESQRWVRNIKDERLVGTPPQATSELVATRLKLRLEESRLEDLLTPTALLVPVPRSSLMKSGALWVPYLLAKAMVRHGLGREVLPCLERIKPTRKSATATSGERPLARDHYDSMRTAPLAFPHDEVVVVDDVVTRGSTLLAAVSRVKDALPGARVRGFAVVRTMSDPQDFRQMFEPSTGHVTIRDNGQTIRRP